MDINLLHYYIFLISFYAFKPIYDTTNSAGEIKNKNLKFLYRE